MRKPSPFFESSDALADVRLSETPNAVIQHEVFFEERLNTIKRRPLFVGRAYEKRRFFSVLIVVGCVILALIGRAVWMQLWHGAAYRRLAEENRLRTVLTWPHRGLVYDRQKNILADNIPRFQVTLTPRELPRSDEEWQLEIGEAARLMGLTIKDFESYRPSAQVAVRDNTVLVVDSLPYRQAMIFAVALPRLPGFRLEVRPRRRYPFSGELTSLAHVIGYVGQLSQEEFDRQKSFGYRQVDEIGKSGLERSYEKALRGQVGERVSEVDARGRSTSLVRDEPQKNGQDLALTLDVDLQRASEQALMMEMRLAGVDRGAVVALDPRDGSILALVSFPAFDNNIFSGSVSSTLHQALLDNPDQPFFPRAWAGTYPSGSTVKVVISVAALMEKIITPETTVLSLGGLQIGPSFFPDWKSGGHGVTNVRKALAWSVNTFFYTIGGGYESFIGLGPDRLADWMRRFGLGQKTGLDLPAEAAGFVPTREWKQATKDEHWFVGDTYNLAIGQGDLLVTPMQVSAYTAAIANGGKLIKPHVVSASSRSAELVTAMPLADQAVIKVVQEGMRDAVRYGSARALGDLPFAMGGKTGTAQ
ncbi:MAG: penicillin-binding protein 2, partial [Candidatus Uhrbacteria bacterium]|nr:penicillin-binding protein 2 [Candidatus Uhrbacteria bacterium]